MRSAIWLLPLATAVSGWASAISEPITSGTADLIASAPGSTSGLETFSIQGADFSFTGSGNQLTRLYGCSYGVGICPPGSHTNPLAGDIGTVTGVSMSGTFTFQGMSENYTAVPGAGIISWITSPFQPLSIPASAIANTLTVSEPFQAAASFVDPSFESGTAFTPLVGQGTVTLNLTRVGNPELDLYYFIQSIHFDFSSPPASATPEPGTASAVPLVVLIAASVSLRKRRR